ncbi:MAG TPA: serine O-acetyltransferase [Dehalococcoidia bacterium]|jgi:serine O-acetyltransferase|nr:serine O-acetyltransferase [Dehalococcoidia bacterium]
MQQEISITAPSPTQKTAHELGLWEILSEDKRTNQESLLRPGFHALVMYRLGNWAMRSPRRKPLLKVAKLMRFLVRNFYGIEMYWEANIGRRFVIGHQGAMVVHQYCTIGDDCTIRQGVTIGAAGEFNPAEAPVLGNNVDVGAGAAILGRVRVGNNVRIGPNAVVMQDVPDNSTVFAAPSRTVSWGEPDETNAGPK